MAKKSKEISSQNGEISPHPTRKKVKFAPIFTRFKAFVIDIFLIAMPLLYFTTYVIMGDKTSFQNSPTAVLGVWAVYGLITAFLQTKFAQTPGLRANDAYLIDIRNGKKANLLRTLFRYALFIVFGWLFVICFFRKDKLNIHDILSQTAVVIKTK